MDIVSVAVPKRRRRRKKESDMTDTAFNPQFSIDESEDTNPAVDPPVIVETTIDQSAVVEDKPISRDIGNWKHALWHGKDMWTNPRTHQTLFDEKKVRKLRHQ